MRQVATKAANNTQSGPNEPSKAASYADVTCVHEWLEGRAGSEWAFRQIVRALPGAQVAALTYDESSSFEFSPPPTTTLLSRLPASVRGRRDVLLPTMPIAWHLLGRRLSADILLTSSHAFAKHAAATIRPRVHLSYTYTPMRYAWLGDESERGSAITRAGARLARPALRRMDLRDAAGVTSFAAISTEVRERIRRFYGRDSRVIFPPVDTTFFHPAPSVRTERLLAISRFVPYKRLDLAIAAAAKAGVPITVAGDGPDEARLHAVAAATGADVEWRPRPSNEVLRDLYRTSRLLVFPADEDFGIVPVEAQACGLPVVGLQRGGTLDTVIEGVTGCLATEQTVEAFASAITAALSNSFDDAALRAHACTFAPDVFSRSIADWVEEFR